jgi:hypothetical protein
MSYRRQFNSVFISKHNGHRKRRDLNRGFEGDISPSWGDRSEAKARGGVAP